MEVKVWSDGQTYKQSNKNDKPLLNGDNEIIHNVAYRGAYNIKKNDKINKEKTDEIMKRRMTIQTFQNPFLHKNIGQVLDDQEKYLKPQNSLINNEPLNLQ